MSQVTRESLLQHRPASIKDIARLAGVSHSTVSRALRGSSLVAAETAGRIRRIAEESGYSASAAARSLVTHRTDTVGVVVTNIADPFAAEVVNGIEEAAGELGLSVILANSNAEPEREIRIARSMRERRVDGIIVTSSRVGALHAPALSAMGVAVVLLNNQHPSQTVHSVMIGNTEASVEAVRHLVGLGHRRIAYLGDRHGHQSDTERFAGYRRALEGAGLEFDPELVAHGNGKAEGAAEPMKCLLGIVPAPTAVFCYNDMSALGAIRAIRAHGLRVPADISIVGFDDLPIMQFMDPPLTTVCQPMRQMGRLAVQTLARLVAGEVFENNIIVPGRLVVRNSTAPPGERTA